jgi:phosphatidylserine/phosphatidylglycerophosphate/cardiolipin synthase-like enzyme
MGEPWDKSIMFFRILTGKAIPVALYEQLRKPLKRIFIVTPFLEDYEFFGRSPLSKFLSKHASEGAGITLLTMPPEGTNGTARSFTRKYQLLEQLTKEGVDVRLNVNLHAKVFLFDESAITRATILGSANLTTAAMNERLEIALLTYNRELFGSVLSIVYKFWNNLSTKTFMKWKLENAVKIRSVLGGK